ncbi:mediator of DNA damage checkpoint protein 1-like [Xenopus laevis]|uniref:Mediator of DNA damage checkpoint protein 1-like n=1 Tax=Xenopus laevis TaxID=8355 RepID=A0A8J1MWY7_XENLA|nr:mediator of DNA damage checkpoint protein 1-like [Xenopus laevis]
MQQHIKKSNMNIMKIFYLFLIECIIIGISLPFAETKIEVPTTVTAGQIELNGEVEDATVDSCPECKYTGYIIILSAMVTIALPGAFGWYLYYRLKKRNAMTDEEKALEDSKPDTFTSKIHLWLATNCTVEKFKLLYNTVRENKTVEKIIVWLSTNCTAEKFKLLFDRLRKKKPIYDEEKAIEKSQPESTPSKSETTARDMLDTGEKTATTKEDKEDSATKQIKVTKKKKASVKQSTDEPVQPEQSPQTLALPKKIKVIKKKKKKAPVKKSVEESINSVKQSTDEPVQPAQSPQTLALPKKIKVIKKKKAPVNKSVEESLKTPSVKQSTDEPVQPEQSPQTLALPKKIKVIKKKKKKAPVDKSVEESIKTLSVKQSTDEPVQPEQSPQTLALPKKIKVIKKKKKKAPVQPEQSPQTLALPKENAYAVDVTEAEQQPMAPLAVSVLSTETKDVQTEISISPIIPECQQPLVESQEETPCNIYYKRKIVLTWVEEITDDEEETSTPQVKEFHK